VEDAGEHVGFDVYIYKVILAVGDAGKGAAGIVHDVHMMFWL
jgi:hypothetical protein